MSPACFAKQGFKRRISEAWQHSPLILFSLSVNFCKIIYCFSFDAAAQALSRFFLNGVEIELIFLISLFKTVPLIIFQVSEISIEEVSTSSSISSWWYGWWKTLMTLNTSDTMTLNGIRHNQGLIPLYQTMLLQTCRPRSSHGLVITPNSNY